MRLSLVLFSFLVSLKLSAQTATALFELDLTLSAQQSLPLSDNLRFHVESKQAKAVSNNLSKWKNIEADLVSEEVVSITLSGHPEYTGDIKEQYTSESFVIDIEEKSTKKFIAEFEQQTSDKFTLDELTAFASNYIEDRTYIHGFHFASTVAAERSGDCTEFAVLTTALARSQGLAARVVLGTVIREETDRVHAYGHAWTEVFYEGKWHLLDAALYGADNPRLFYLPSSALDNEGAGYSLSLAQSLSLSPNKIAELHSF